VSSRLLGSGAIGAVLDASNWAASRPDLGLAALTPRVFCFLMSGYIQHDVRVASSGRGGQRTGEAYCFHPLFGGGGCLTSASIGGLRMLPRALLLLW